MIHCFCCFKVAPLSRAIVLPRRLVRESSVILPRAKTEHQRRVQESVAQNPNFRYVGILPFLAWHAGF